MKSNRDDRYYIGSISDVNRRLWQHKEGLVYSTRRMLPIGLVFFQEVDSLTEAREIERKLKRFKSRHIIEQIIESVGR